MSDSSLRLNRTENHHTMSHCKHTGWIRLWRNNGQPSLETTDRPHRLTEEFSYEDKPGVALLIGSQTKSMVLSDLCSKAKRPQGLRHHGDIHLHASHVRPTRPFLIADGDIPTHNRLSTCSKSYRCHESQETPFLKEPLVGRAGEIADKIYQRVLIPFADVICLFVADIGGADFAIQRLAAWVPQDQLHTSPFKPVLLLVISRGQKKRVQSAVEGMTGLNYFEQVRIVTFSPSHSAMWQRRQILMLRRRLFQAIDLAQERRRHAGSLFSACHLAAFIQAAADGLSELPHAPMDVIKTSRRTNPVASDLSVHLTNWFKQFDDHGVLERFAIPLASSSIILDNYPSGMHRKHCRRPLPQSEAKELSSDQMI